jgi:hypothetical protein
MPLGGWAHSTWLLVNTFHAAFQDRCHAMTRVLPASGQLMSWCFMLPLKSSENSAEKAV